MYAVILLIVEILVLLDQFS